MCGDFGFEDKEEHDASRAPEELLTFLSFPVRRSILRGCMARIRRTHDSLGDPTQQKKDENSIRTPSVRPLLRMELKCPGETKQKKRREPWEEGHGTIIPSCTVNPEKELCSP